MNGSNTLIGRSNNNAPVTINDPNVKKESRLKHFFSPIRKKIAPTPPVISQPDVFISNILPSNMFINPIMQSQSSRPETSTKPESQVGVASPTSSFQVSFQSVNTNL